MAREASKIFVARGKNYVSIDMKKDAPGDDELAKLIVGPSGNLRAPTIRKGKTLFVGFNAEAYAKGFD